MNSRRGQKGTTQRARTKKKPPKPWTQARTLKAQARFLREFSLCGNVLRSAKAVRVGRSTVYKWLAEAKFKDLYDQAHEDALDTLEEEARRRAVDGVMEPVVSAGALVTHVRKYSDTLLITLLKGKRPDTYRERHEVTGKNGKDLLPAPSTMTDEELRAELVATATALGLKVVDADA